MKEDEVERCSDEIDDVVNLLKAGRMSKQRAKKELKDMVEEVT